MRSNNRLLLAALFLLASSPLTYAQNPDLQSARRWIVDQPRDFSNEVLFELRDQTVVRSSRYESRGAPFGDFDGDFDLDQHDYYALQICLSFSGPGFAVPPACLVFDRDGDDDVDLLDVAEFQSLFTGTVVGVFVEAGELVPVIASPDGYYSGAPGTWGNNALNGIARHGGYSQDDFWYQWTLIAKPENSGSVLISNSAFPATAYTVLPPLRSGDYVFQLKVTNLVTIEFGLDTTTLTLHLAEDVDNDGVADSDDNCPTVLNPSQTNFDADVAGDVCDNCPQVANDSQTDSDADRWGNVCDNCAIAANPNQADFDSDGIGDACDNCTLVSNPNQADTDNDGDGNSCDNCPAIANPDQADTDGDGDGNVCDNCPTDANPDQANSDGDACGDVCEVDCIDGPICGNGGRETGEQCDDGNTSNGDGCSSTCQLEASGIANDDCSSPTAVGEGTQVYSNVGATTDGSAEPLDCTFFSNSNIRSDIWYCYTATCTGQAVISLCGSGYDTKMAVYSSCGCPSAEPAVDRPIGCSDDDCGSGADNSQSRVAISATTGQSYLVRVGGFAGNREQGEGRLTIRCGQDTCANGTGDCLTAHDEGQPGCSTASCCNRVCEVDTFCCDVTWDAFCASQAEGFCNPNGFPTCNAQAGSCSAEQTTPGCSNTDCCNAVCESDPFCCIREWDENCVNQGSLICDAYGQGRGDCFAARTAPGCNDVPCCAMVCAADNFCCESEWDQTCVEQAEDLCTQ